MARRHPLVDAPHKVTVSMSQLVTCAINVVSKNAEVPCFSMIGS